MKWGQRREAKYAEAKGKTKRAARHRDNAKQDLGTSRKSASAKSSKDISSVYQQERKRQKKHLATKRAIDIGSRVVNEYTKRHNVSINGIHVGVHDNVKLIVNKLLDYKYMKDSFK
jgi:hypothetical protein